MVLKIFIRIPSILNLKIIILILTIQKKKFKKAYEYCRTLCLKNPNSMEYWFTLSMIEKKTSFAVSKTLRFTLRILKKNPTSIPGMIFAGNHCSFYGSYGYALAEYFQAYRWKKDSSFLNFCIHVQYLLRSLNRRNKAPEHMILMSISFFFHYKMIRSYTIEAYLKRTKNSAPLKIEIFYNKARLYLFLGINYLSVKNFTIALRKKRSFNSITKNKRHFEFKKSLETDSLYNISLFYKLNGNKILSNEKIREKSTLIF